jgi:hypothetical protein
MPCSAGAPPSPQRAERITPARPPARSANIRRAVSNALPNSPECTASRSATRSRPCSVADHQRACLTPLQHKSTIQRAAPPKKHTHSNPRFDVPTTSSTTTTRESPASALAFGMRVMPPTSRISLISEAETPASFMQSLHGCRVRFSKASVSCSNLLRVMAMLRCLAPARAHACPPCPPSDHSQPRGHFAQRALQVAWSAAQRLAPLRKAGSCGGFLLARTPGILDLNPKP